MYFVKDRTLVVLDRIMTDFEQRVVAEPGTHSIRCAPCIAMPNYPRDLRGHWMLNRGDVNRELVVIVGTEYRDRAPPVLMLTYREYSTVNGRLERDVTLQHPMLSWELAEHEDLFVNDRVNDLHTFLIDKIGHW